MLLMFLKRLAKNPEGLTDTTFVLLKSFFFQNQFIFIVNFECKGKSQYYTFLFVSGKSVSFCDVLSGIKYKPKTFPYSLTFVRTVQPKRARTYFSSEKKSIAKMLASTSESVFSELGILAC